MFKYVDNSINTRNCLRAYRQVNLQIPAGIHKMVFVNSFAYISVNVWNQINLEVFLNILIVLYYFENYFNITL